MDALLLPGNSPRHAEWVEQLKQSLSPDYHTIIAHHYRHWQTGEPKAAVDTEITDAYKEVQKLDSYVIIAKSIGTVIAAKATAKGVFTPQKLVFLGVPIDGGADVSEFRSWLTQITVPVVIIQNSQDPLGTYVAIAQAFHGIEQVSCIEQPGAHHDYQQIDVIRHAALLSPQDK